MENVESRYASQSKEMNLLQTKIVLNNKDYSKESDLQKTIRELEGEVHILSLREKEFQ